jgi:cytochrome c biogenesis protein ResB
MRARSIFASGVLFLSMVALGNAKSWDIVVGSATRAGSVTLPAGNYSVKLNNNQAQFTSDSGKTFTVAVKVENAAKKYDQTAVQTQTQGDTQVMQSIDLGGSTQQLDFGE